MIVPLAAIARTAEPAAENGDVDPQRVREAIEKGVAYLKRSQGSNAPIGCWSDHVGYPGGTTALCTLALLNCGVPADDEHIQQALNYLRTISSDDKSAKVYTISLQTMVLCLAEPVKSYALIKRNALWLEMQQIRDEGNPRRGAWSYPGAAAATIPTPSSPCSRSMRPSASACPFQRKLGGSRWPIGSRPRTSMARSTTTRCRALTTRPPPAA